MFADSNSLLLTSDNSQFTDGITQALTTTPGGLYNVSFYADADGGNTFSVLFGGRVVPGSPTTIAENGFPRDTTGGGNPNAGQFTFYSFFAPAASASSLLTFLGNSDNSIELDNIRVVPVPETASSASFGLLLCLGFGGLAAFRRRKVGERVFPVLPP